MESRANSTYFKSFGRARSLSSSEAVGVVLIVLLLAIPAVFAAQKPSRFDELVIQLDDDEVTAGRKASLLRSLDEKEIDKFIAESAAWIPAASGFELGRWIRSIDNLSRNKSFRAKDAKAVLEILSKQKRGFGLDGRFRSLSIRLQSKANELDSNAMSKEWSYLADKKVPSADRLAVVGALTDSMQEVGVKPAISDLEKLLANDVYEIRMHAVDWFRITDFSEKDRFRFLKVAIKTNPYQVRERVYRFLASLEDKEFLAFYREVAGAKNGISCILDKSEVTRKMCEDIEARATQLGKKGEP